jgi:molybdopterin converting factor small subunit
MKIKLVVMPPFKGLDEDSEREINLYGNPDERNPDRGNPDEINPDERNPGGENPNVMQLLETVFDEQTRSDLLIDEEGELRPTATVLLNGRHVNTLHGVRTGLQEGDEVAVFPPVAGG